MSTFCATSAPAPEPGQGIPTIQEIVSNHVSQFELTGLERCVKQLRGKKLWSRDCDVLRAEIVSFVREQIGIANPAAREIAFSLS